MSNRIITYREPQADGSITPGLMECDCGKHLHMTGGGRDIHCRCGRSYNSGGSLLAPRSQWGEETGETAQDYDAGVAEAEAERLEERLRMEGRMA